MSDNGISNTRPLDKSFPQPEGAPFLISSRSIMHRDSCWHTNILIVGWPFHSHVLRYESRSSHHRTIKRGAPSSCGKTTLLGLSFVLLIFPSYSCLQFLTPVRSCIAVLQWCLLLGRLAIENANLLSLGRGRNKKNLPAVWNITIDLSVSLTFFWSLEQKEVAEVAEGQVSETRPSVPGQAAW
jgi:hypothetical protein